MRYACSTLLAHSIRNLIIYSVFFISFSPYLFAQPGFCDGTAANSGNIATGTGFGNPTLLNPDNDGEIWQTTNPYLTNPAALDIDEFEQLTTSGNSIGGTPCTLSNQPWQEITGASSEPHDDNKSAKCGAADIVNQGDDNGYAYYTIIDQDCDLSTTTDAYVAFRVRIAKESSGAFGFSMLIDTDGDCGGWTSADGCLNPCFEREVWLGSGGGNTGLHINDIDGVNVGTEIGFIDITATQVACTHKTPAACNNNAIFYTFAVPFDNLGLTHGNIQLGIAPATSSSPQAVIDGNNSFDDVGGVNGDAASAPNCPCTGLTGNCLNACLLACAATNNAVTFPVEYLSFQANAEAGQIALNWATASELNNDYFIVERMLENDSRSFEELGVVQGSGTSQETHEYQFRDLSPNPAVNYYRLKQVDYDGKYTYSQVIEIQSDLEGMRIQVAPTVITDWVNLTIMNPEFSQARVEVFSIDGKTVHNRTQEVEQGTQVIRINANAYPAGIYSIRVYEPRSKSYFYTKFLKV